MKIEKLNETETTEPVAYLIGEDILMFRASFERALMVQSQPGGKTMWTMEDEWLPFGSDKTPIYPGDTIKITF